MTDTLIEVDDGSFESKVLQSDKPVLVDFWAPWCGPCKAIGPVIEKLAGVYGGQCRFAKCNVDDNPVTPGKYGIKAIPMLLFFKQGKMVDKITGMITQTQIEDAIKRMLEGAEPSQPFIIR
jgi:thioredoxin 1